MKNRKSNKSKNYKVGKWPNGSPRLMMKKSYAKKFFGVAHKN